MQFILCGCIWLHSSLDIKRVLWNSVKSVAVVYREKEEMESSRKFGDCAYSQVLQNRQPNRDVIVFKLTDNITSSPWLMAICLIMIQNYDGFWKDVLWSVNHFCLSQNVAPSPVVTWPSSEWLTGSHLRFAKHFRIMQLLFAISKILKISAPFLHPAKGIPFHAQKGSELFQQAALSTGTREERELKS